MQRFTYRNNVLALTIPIAGFNATLHRSPLTTFIDMILLFYFIYLSLHLFFFKATFYHILICEGQSYDDIARVNYSYNVGTIPGLRFPNFSQIFYHWVFCKEH
jgi:hypothetical protein